VVSTRFTFGAVPDEDGRLAELFGVKAVPASYIIDSKGLIKVKEVGITTTWGLRARLWYAQNIDGFFETLGFSSAQADDKITTE